MQNRITSNDAGAVLARRTIWTHGLLALPLSVIGYPLNIWIPPHYAGTLGLPLATLGLIIMLARLTDVITDPLIGELSDRTRGRFGRRKPYIVLGTPLMMLGAWCLFVPPSDAGLVYFLVWLSLFFLGSTLIQLPHAAWGAELSPDYHQRSRVTAAREFYVLGGLMAAAAVPLVVEVMAGRGLSLSGALAHGWQQFLALFPSSTPREALEPVAAVARAAMTGPVLVGLAWLIVLLLPICALAVLTVREPEAPPRQRIPLREGARHLWRNGPMKRILLITLLVHFGESFRNAVSVFFIRDIVGIGTIGSVYFMYFAAGIAAIPFWLWLGRKVGKHRAFVGTLVVVGLVSAANFPLEQGDHELFFMLFLLKGFCFGGLQFLPLAMLADVVDVDSLRSGGRRAGTYFALVGMMVKLAIAFGTGSSLIVVGALGFDAATGLAGSTDAGVLALRIGYTIGPLLFYGSALWLIWTYPLTPERHARLRARVERRIQRIAAREAAR
ncbi:MAG: MFS transporter [Pseudomonadales bacterium]|nr:MFS transporter [Pseudomonadales bacterium]